MSRTVLFLLFTLLSTACLESPNDDCRVEHLALTPAQIEGEVEWAHGNALLFIGQGTAYWPIPSDAVSVMAKVAIPDFAAGPEVIEMELAETTLAERESDADRTITAVPWELPPDIVTDIEIAAQIPDAPKSLALRHSTVNTALYVHQLQVQRCP